MHLLFKLLLHKLLIDDYNYSVIAPTEFPIIYTAHMYFIGNNMLYIVVLSVVCSSK